MYEVCGGHDLEIGHAYELEMKQPIVVDRTHLDSPLGVGIMRHRHRIDTVEIRVEYIHFHSPGELERGLSELLRHGRYTRHLELEMKWLARGCDTNQPPIDKPSPLLTAHFHMST